MASLRSASVRFFSLIFFGSFFILTSLVSTSGSATSSVFPLSAFSTEAFYIFQRNCLAVFIRVLQDVGDFFGNFLRQIFCLTQHGNRRGFYFLDNLVPRRTFQRIIPALYFDTIAISIAIGIPTEWIGSIQFFFIVAQAILIGILENIFRIRRIVRKYEKSRAQNEQAEKKK